MSDGVTPAELLDLLIGRADELRAAGVLRLKVGGLEVELAPRAPAHNANTQPRDREADAEREEVDPFNDPATFGLRAGVPGFNRPKDDE